MFHWRPDMKRFTWGIQSSILYTRSCLFEVWQSGAIAYLAPPEKSHQAKNILLKIYILIEAA